MEDLRGHGAYSSLPGTMQTNKEFPSTEYNEILETRRLFLAPMHCNAEKEDTFHSPSGEGPYSS